MSIRNRNLVPARRTRKALSGSVLVLALLWSGCDGLLTVENPGEIADEDLDLPSALDPLVTGVAGDFAVALRYTAVNMALYANEFIHTGSFPSWRVWETGASRRPSSEANGQYNAVARAVWVADNAIERLDRILENSGSRAEMAEVLMWGGFARFLYADNFCEATFDGGSPVPPQQIYQMAEERLTQAIQVATAAGENAIRIASQAGRARARLMQGDHSGARDDAAAVPNNFLYNVIYSQNSSREYNWIATYSTTIHRREVGVHPDYYTDQRYIDDPRTPFLDRGPNAHGPDEIRQFVEQLQFPNNAAPIALANTQEARLIEAEAEFRLANLPRAVAIIDELRANAGLDPYSGPVTQDAVWEQILYERSAELWLRGQRWVDMYRSNHPHVATTDGCIEIGQTEWQTNPHLGAGQ